MKRFDLSNFKSVQDLAENSEELCHALSQRIAERIHQVAFEEWMKITEELTSLGHDIEVKEVGMIKEFCSREYCSDAPEEKIDGKHLRVHFDSQVSSYFQEK